MATDAARADTWSNVLTRNALLHAGQSVDDNLQHAARFGRDCRLPGCGTDVAMWRDVRAFNLANRCSERPS